MRKQAIIGMRKCAFKIDSLKRFPTFRECQCVMTFVQLSDGVETAVTGLDEVRGAPLHDEANVGHVDIAQPVDALHLRIDETLFRIFGDSLVNSTMQ